MKHIISLGAGVQSSTMALMAAHGEITPMPDAAIFADTQAEPQSVYRWLDWLADRLPYPLFRVSRGDLGLASCRIRVSRAGNLYTKHAIPAFITDGKSQGLMIRHCTSDFKITMIHRQIRAMREGRQVIQWIGISDDEVDRVKPATIKRPTKVIVPATLFEPEREETVMESHPHPYITNRWPLIELGMSRQGCKDWMRAKGYPEPPRSACVFCPYHSDDEWIRLRDEEPEEFAKAVDYEVRLQRTMAQVSGFRGEAWLHRSMVPLSEVKFLPGTGNKQFTNECEGMCGV